MVGREHQDAVLHRAAELGAVFVVAKRRGHLVVRVVAGYLAARDREVVRRRLRRHGKALLLRLAHERHALCRRDVLDMQAAAGHAAKRQVAANRLRLGGNRNRRQMELLRDGAVANHAVRDFLRVHRMLADAHAEPCRAAHRLLHHLVVCDVRAVVGEKRSSCIRQRLEVGDLAPGAPLRYACRRQKHNVAAGGTRRVALVLDELRRLARRRRVRHRHDCCKAAAARRIESARRRLRLGHSGVAEVHVHVDEAWICQQPAHAARGKVRT